MSQAREEFFEAVETKLSGAEDLLSNPEALTRSLVDLQSLLEREWPNIFASLDVNPLSEQEKEAIRNLINRLSFFDKGITQRLKFFDDFKKYAQVFLEK